MLDLSDTQRELVDINQRYDLLGEKLADRRRELEGMAERMKVHVQDLHDIQRWLEDKEKTIPSLQDLPTKEDEAKEKLKEHQEFP